MKQNLVILLSLGLFLTSSCVQEDYPQTYSKPDVGPNTPPPPPPPFAPCDFFNYAFVEGFTGTKGAVALYPFTQPNLEGITLKFGSSSYDLVIRVKSPDSFKNLGTIKVDLGMPPTSGPEIDMYISRFSSSYYYATRGKLYIVSNPDGSVDFDWCEVYFDDGWGGEVESHGGFTLK